MTGTKTGEFNLLDYLYERTGGLIWYAEDAAVREAYETLMWNTDGCYEVALFDRIVECAIARSPAMGEKPPAGTRYFASGRPALLSQAELDAEAISYLAAIIAQADHMRASAA